MALLSHHRPDAHWGLGVWGLRPTRRAFPPNSLSRHLSHVPPTPRTTPSTRCRHSLHRTRQGLLLKAGDHLVSDILILRTPRAAVQAVALTITPTDHEHRMALIPCKRLGAIPLIYLSTLLSQPRTSWTTCASLASC